MEWEYRDRWSGMQVSRETVAAGVQGPVKRLNKHIYSFLLKVSVNGHTNPSREAERLPIDVIV